MEKEQDKAIKKASIRVLVLIFLNITVWLAGGLLFIYLERPAEAVHKCGVRRVKRDFLDGLWTESKSLPESDWKSSARKKLENFENELQTAVEAGLNSYSDANVWTVSNAIFYTFTMSTTIGYGSLTPASVWVRLFSLLYAAFACPLAALLIGDMAGLIQLVSERAQLSVTDSFRNAFFLIGSHMTFGMLMFSYLFEWGPEDSLYFVATTISTIGFGDIVPENTFAYLVFFVYIVAGLAIYGVYQDHVVGWLTGKVDDLCVKLEPAAVTNGTAAAAEKPHAE
eukprot:TRINITY_DN10519_c0_g1_i1.p1 TRINITY_DN10519_c0_g1~~TRINITY_DN10519_c0_g1_i1.p1  ORF type:complete len:282 (-),score=82.08 TRINITY_DN10519_c0_g1_i1:200-1045(-)